MSMPWDQVATRRSTTKRSRAGSGRATEIAVQQLVVSRDRRVLRIAIDSEECEHEVIFRGMVTHEVYVVVRPFSAGSRKQPRRVLEEIADSGSYNVVSKTDCLHTLLLRAEFQARLPPEFGDDPLDSDDA